MPAADAFLYIDVPPARVRRWVFAAPLRVPLWWRQVARIEPAPAHPGSAGRAFHYAYDLMGMRMRGTFTAHSGADALLIQTISGVEAQVRFALAAAGDGTSLGVRVSYALPGALLGGVLNQRRAEQAAAADLTAALLLLKALVERPHG